jgi:hypothetical protein
MGKRPSTLPTSAGLIAEARTFTRLEPVGALGFGIEATESTVLTGPVWAKRTALERIVSDII